MILHLFGPFRCLLCGDRWWTLDALIRHIPGRHIGAAFVPYER